MTTIKSHTDLEQSKKLAEFLPLESADFHFSANLSPKGYLEKPIWGNPEYANYNAFPCWSLSALLATLPVNIEYKGELLRLRLDLGEKDFNIWYDNTDTGNASDIDILADNPIDACYEMIIKLHEQKLL